MKKKTLLTAISVVLVLAMVVGGTLAYLQDTSGPKENVFQKNTVEVKLDETATSPFSIIPGTTVTKDPKVTVNVTLPSYVFVKVEDRTDGLVTYSIASGWTKLENGVYYREQGPVTENEETTTQFTYEVLKDNKITYANTITNDDMNAARETPKLSFTSYVIQTLKSQDLTVQNSTPVNFTPAEAWAVVNGGTTSGTTSDEASSPVATVSATDDTTLTAGVAPALDDNKTTTVTVPAGALNAGDTAYVKVSTENGVIAITDGSGVAATIDVDLYVNNQKTTTADNTLTGENQYYTVATTISAGLEDVGLIYGTETWAAVTTANDINAANQFFYDSSNGTFIFTTTHFSKFTVTSDAFAYVTETDTVYKTLTNAIDAAPSGATVTLLATRDISSEFNSDTARLPISKSITVDGGGNTVIVKARGFGVGMNTDDKIDVIFKNITIVNNNGSGRCIDTRGNLNSLTLDGVILSTPNSATQPLTIGGNQSDVVPVTIKNSTIKTMDDGSYGYAITTFNPVDMKITGSTIKGWACFNIKGPNSSAGSSGSTFTIENSTLATKNVYPGVSNAYGLLKLEDVSINVSITGCSISVDGDKNSQSIGCFESGALNNVTITLGEGNNVVMTNDACFAHNSSDTAVLEVAGGTYNVDPTDYLAPGCTATKNSNGTWTVNAGIQEN